MKNITVSVDDEVYRKVRIRAAERDTSVSAMVREYLNGVGNDQGETAEERFARGQRLMEEVMERIKGSGFSASENLSRDDIHDRRLARS